VLTKLVDRYLRHRFAWLFLALMVTIGVQPLMETVRPGLGLLQILLALSLFAAIASAAGRRGFRLLIGVGLLWIVIRVLRASVGGETMVFMSEALWVSGCVLAMAATARWALRPGAVDRERVFAALDTYLMAGLLFGVCFWTFEQIWPASFAAPDAADLDPQAAIYFSFITLATLGYGDIVPVGSAARGMAVLEAVAGQLYLVVLVSRLVSLYSTREGA
jgi:Ion channel